jgi:hypothetical protein
MVVHALEITSILPIPLAIGRHYFVRGIFFGGIYIITLDTPIAMFEGTDKVLDNGLPACQELTGYNGAIGNLVQFRTASGDGEA